jgi:integrase-like protein
VDMVPTVRRVLEDLSARANGKSVSHLVFPGTDGGVFSRGAMWWAWSRTIAATKVRPIRPYDLRHTFASLLIAAGKNPLYIARQMGHYSAGFTLETYGHLMDSIPRRPVEWIDELVFPEGFEVALKLHLDALLRDATPCRPVQPEEWLEPSPGAVPGSVVQSDAARCLVPRAGFEPALPA